MSSITAKDGNKLLAYSVTIAGGATAQLKRVVNSESIKISDFQQVETTVYISGPVYTTTTPFITIKSGAVVTNNGELSIGSTVGGSSGATISTSTIANNGVLRIYNYEVASDITNGEVASIYINNNSTVSGAIRGHAFVVNKGLVFGVGVGRNVSLSSTQFAPAGFYNEGGGILASRTTLTGTNAIFVNETGARVDFGVTIDGTNATVQNWGGFRGGLSVLGKNSTVSLYAPSANHSGYLTDGIVVGRNATSTTIDNRGRIFGTVSLMSTGNTFLNSGYVQGQLYVYGNQSNVVNRAGGTIATNPVILYGSDIHFTNQAGSTLNTNITVTGGGDTVSLSGSLKFNPTISFLPNRYNFGNGRLVLAQDVITNLGATVKNSQVNTVLELAAGGTVGASLARFTGNWNSFASIQVDAGATWTLAGTAAGYSFTTPIVTSGTLVNAASIAGPVAVKPGGVVVNQAGGVITGTYAITVASGAGTITNAGTIYTAATYTGGSYHGGIVLNAGGTVTNLAGGAINALYGFGIEFRGTASGTVINGGFIGGNGRAVIFGDGDDRLALDPSASFGGSVNGGLGNNVVELRAGQGTFSPTNLVNFNSFIVDNNASWTVPDSPAATISFTNGATVNAGGTLINREQIVAGVTLGGTGATWTNASTGRITRASGDVVFGSGGASTIVNGGTILSTDTVNPSSAIFLSTGGTITNTAGAVIKSNNGAGIYFRGSVLSTVTNAGTISSGNNAAIVNVNRLIDLPSAVFVGNVQAAGANSVLELASAATAGTLSGLGTNFNGFSSVVVDAGASWTLAGTNTVAQGTKLTNAGTLKATGTLVNRGTLGSGVDLTSLNRLVFNPGASFQGVVQGAAAGVLELASAASAGTLANLATSFTGFGTITVDGGANWSLVSASLAGRTLVNSGSLAGDVAVGAGGVLVNAAGGQFGGQVTATTADASVSNAGTITGGFIGVTLTAGGTVTNLAGGTIRNINAVWASGMAATLANSGYINGFYFGARMDQGGVVTNNAGGTIVGKLGVYMSGNAAGTVINAGTIIGSTSTAAGLGAVQFGTGADRLIVRPGGAFVGTVRGGGANSTLELASGASAGTLAGLGSSFVGFGSVTVDGGATWSLTGANTVVGGTTLFNSGLLDVPGSLLDSNVLINAGVLSGNLTVGAGGRLTNNAGATINPALGGVVIAGGTLATSGAIVGQDTTGTRYAVKFGTAGGRLVVTPGATLAGKVGGNAASVVELASAATGGTLIGLDAFANIGAITVNTGATWTLANTGTLTGTTTLTNSGTLVAGNTLVDSGVLVNAGVLSGAVSVTAGSLTNNAGATVGGNLGVGYRGSLINAGTVSGRIQLNAAGVITNNAGGLIGGIDVPTGNGGTVINAGTINAGTGTALQFGFNNIPGAQRLVVKPGAVFVGTVVGGSDGLAAGSVLELASASTAGTLTGLGTSVFSFGFIEVDAGATWTLAGPSRLSKLGVTTLTNNGTLAGDLTITTKGAVTNTATGRIGGQLVASGGAVQVSNAGTITGGRVGVSLSSSGTVTNLAGGRISNYAAIVATGPDAVTVANSGILAGDMAGTGAYGVRMASGGTLTNNAGATVSGHIGVYVAGSGAGTLVNAGTIIGSTASGGAAVKFGSGVDRLVVKSGAVFVGAVQGGGANSTLELASSAAAGTLANLGSFANFGSVTVDAGAAWTLDAGATLTSGMTLQNGGTLAATGTLADNGVLINTGLLLATVDLGAGGMLTNSSTGRFSGSVRSNAAGVGVSNAGTISSTFYALYFAAGGTVTNLAGGTISSNYAVVIGRAAGTVVNSGSIGARYFGVSLGGGGTITNNAGATISGQQAVKLDGAGTVVNAGVIDGLGKVAVMLDDSGANRLVLRPGSTVIGLVQGGGANSTLELASAASAGSLSNLGSSVTGFGAIVVDSGASWTLGGASSIGSGVTLTTAGTISGATAATALTFATGPNRLVVNAGAAFTGAVQGGGAASVLELASSASVGTLANLGSIAGFGSITVDSGARWALTGTSSIAGGVTLTNAGTLTKASGDVIVGVSGPSTVINTGRIEDTDTVNQSTGVFLSQGGNIVNAAGAAIVSGKGAGIYFRGAVLSTVTNAGTISSGNNAAIVNVNRLIETPGAVIVGQVRAGGANSVLELASAASVGTLTGLGTSFTGFGSVVVDAGASWILTGTNTAGSITLSSTATLSVAGSVSSNIAFAGGGTLAIAATGSLAGTITGFGGGGVIDLRGTAFDAGTVLNLNTQTDVLTLTRGASSTALQLSGDFTGTGFALASDGAGGTAITSTAVTLSAALASDTGASASDHITSNAALTGTAGANRVVTIRNGATVLGTTTASLSGAWTYAPTLVDGAYTLTASETNDAGQVLSTNVALTLDRVAILTMSLASDTGVSAVDRVTSSAVLTGTADAGGTVTINLGTTVLGSTTADDLGRWSYTPALSNGVRSLTATITDLAGNTALAALQITYDTVAPTVTMALLSDTGNSSADRLTSNIALTGKADANSTVVISNGATVLASVTANASGAWGYTPALSDGTYTLTATQTDLAGNVGAATLTFTKDTTPPPVTIALVSDTGVSATDLITSSAYLTGTTVAGQSVTLTSRVGAANIVTADAQGRWNLAFSPPEGSYTVTATVRDLAGNVGTTTLTFTLDQTAQPIVASLVADTGDSASDRVTSNAALTGTAEAYSTVTIKNGGSVLGSTTVDGQGRWAFAPSLGDGSYALTFVGTDLAGNLASASLASFRLDTTAPAVAITSPGGTTSQVLQLVTGSTSASEAGRTVILLDGATQVGSGTVRADGTFRVNTALVAAGGHSLTAQVTSLAGNVGSSGAVAYTLAPPSGTVVASQGTTLAAGQKGLVLTGSGLTGTGNDEGDLLVSLDGGNTLVGGAGLDTFVSGIGADTMQGGAGLDYVDYSASAEAVQVNMVTGVNHGGNAEGDVLSGIEVVIGSGYGDLLTTDGNNHYLFGGGGNDTLVGGAGNSRLYGGDGNDSITGGSGIDVLDGGAGDDTMAGGAGSDVYAVDSLGDIVIENANEGTDLVQASIGYTLGANLENLQLLGSLGLTGIGNELANAIQGSAGNDLVYGLGGNDDLRGNLGDDTLDGGDGNDALYGGDGQDSLLGGIGNDVLYGDAGQDTLLGGDGNDTLNGGTGADSMAGGTGDDVYYVDNTGDVVTELAGEGKDTAYVSVGNWTMGANLEVATLSVAALLTGNNDANQVFGSGGADTIYGLGGNDDLRGAAGNDVLDGGAGADNLYGGDGQDSLLGGADNDTLRGEGGDDTLVGGAGSDLLLGGAGADLFVWGTDALGGKDVVSDFSRSDGDKIDLSALHLTQVATHTGAGQFTLSYVASVQATVINAWSGGNTGAAADLTITAYATGTGPLISSDFKL